MSSISLLEINKYLPPKTGKYLLQFLNDLDITFKIVTPRKTKLGDCRFPRKSDKKITITINNDLSKVQFAITALHEVAHALTFRKHHFKVKPHGPEWKSHFSQILAPIALFKEFNEKEIQVINNIVSSPKSTSYGIEYLRLEQPLKQNHILLKDITSSSFTFNSRSFRIIKKNRTRFLCEDLNNGRKYTVHSMAQVIQS